MSEPKKDDHGGDHGKKKPNKLLVIGLGALFVVLFIFWMSSMIPIGIGGAAGGVGQSATELSRLARATSRFADSLGDFVHALHENFEVLIKVVLAVGVVAFIAYLIKNAMKKSDGAHPPGGH